MMVQEGKVHFKSETLPTWPVSGFQYAMAILERFCSVLEKQNLQPIDTIQGRSIRPVREGIDTPFFKAVLKPFKMEKIEKLTLAIHMIMNKLMDVSITAFPLDDYELPMLALEWAETENTIAGFVDFVPMADLVMREGYRERYLDPLKKYWSRYKELPGIVLNPYEWARQMFSPYSLSINATKDSEQNIRERLDLYQNYLEVWINLCQQAEPIKDDEVRDHIKIRKSKIRRIFLENDEGSKSTVPLIGKELQELNSLCLF